MNAIINRITDYARSKPDAVAYTVYDAAEGGFSVDSLTWKELDEYSDYLGAYIKEHTKKHTPIVVYGHKSKYMIPCFMACVKSGHAYVPVDISVPASRVQDIIDAVEPEIVMSVAEGEFRTSGLILKLNDIESICKNGSHTIDENSYSTLSDTFYIIFTSGSTGKPKGVQITTECLANYCEWAQNLGSRNIAGNLVGGGYSAT